MKTIVIKVGSGVTLTSRSKLDEFRISHIAEQIASLHRKGLGVVLIVSGAVGCGASCINFKPGDTQLKKIAAGIGQVHLIAALHRVFSAKKMIIAQVLLTGDCLSSSETQHSLKETLEYYIKLGVISIINENDVVDLNCFEGNDCLADRIAILLGVKQVIMLSRMEKSIHGVGGGELKQKTIARLKHKGIQASIVDGKEKNIILNHVL